MQIDINMSRWHQLQEEMKRIEKSVMIQQKKICEVAEKLGIYESAAFRTTGKKLKSISEEIDQKEALLFHMRQTLNEIAGEYQRSEESYGRQD